MCAGHELPDGSLSACRFFRLKLPVKVYYHSREQSELTGEPGYRLHQRTAYHTSTRLQ